jgi:hypothetical protein
MSIGHIYAAEASKNSLFDLMETSSTSSLIPLVSEYLSNNVHDDSYRRLIQIVMKSIISLQTELEKSQLEKEETKSQLLSSSTSSYKWKSLQDDIAFCELKLKTVKNEAILSNLANEECLKESKLAHEEAEERLLKLQQELAVKCNAPTLACESLTSASVTTPA